MTDESGESASEKPPTSESADLKSRVQIHPVWWALTLILLGALGMWHLYAALKDEVTRIAKESSKFPPGAIVAFSLGNEKCPDRWREVTELRGRFIIGAGQGNDSIAAVYGSPGGHSTATLVVNNLPPHRHQVYRHAGEIIGVSSGIQGAGSEDTNVTSHVREGLSGLGADIPAQPSPIEIMPPYFAYTFCRPAE
jgi:hypothetical protein